MSVSQTDIDVAPQAMEIGLLVLARFDHVETRAPTGEARAIEGQGLLTLHVSCL